MYATDVCIPMCFDNILQSTRLFPQSEYKRTIFSETLLLVGACKPILRYDLLPSSERSSCSRIFPFVSPSGDPPTERKMPAEQELGTFERGCYKVSVVASKLSDLIFN